MATTAKLDLVHEAELGNKGLVVTVNDGDIIGHLMIGKASLVWFKKNKKNKGHKVSWKDFQAWIEAKPEGDATRP